MKPLLLAALFLMICTANLAQKISIEREGRSVDLLGLKNIKIHQNILSNGKDSVSIVTEADSLYKAGDTLIVKPWLVDETHYMQPNMDMTVSKVYRQEAASLVKIPISEIDMITGKKRSVSKALSYVSTIAFIAVAASTVLRLSNSDNQQIGTTIFMISAPTLIVSWTLQATIAKKRYHMDKGRTNKKVWVFK